MSLTLVQYVIFIVDILLNYNITFSDQSSKTLEHNQNLEFFCYLSKTGNDIEADTAEHISRLYQSHSAKVSLIMT